MQQKGLLEAKVSSLDRSFFAPTRAMTTAIPTHHRHRALGSLAAGETAAAAGFLTSARENDDDDDDDASRDDDDDVV